MASLDPAPGAPFETPEKTIARLGAELCEAHAQQAATTEILEIINRSGGDLSPVFEAMLERANGLCEADVSTLWTYHDELFFPAAVSQRHDPAAVSTQTGWRPSPNVSLGRLLAGEDVVHVLDVAEDPGYQADAEARARTSAAGGRTILSIPLRKDGQLLGAITTGRRQCGPIPTNRSHCYRTSRRRR
jgi:two-component system, NtrC family, sensor kinase